MAIFFCDINTICETVTISLRYNHLKEEQRVVIISFLLYLWFLQLVLGRLFTKYLW